MNEKKAKLPRREFLANLLFAGGVLSVCGLRDSYDKVARREPKKDGWELPDDLTESRSDDADDGWELPEDLMDSPPPVIKNPPRPVPPEPPIRGGVRPPQPDGGVRPPQVRGKVKCRSAPCGAPSAIW